MDPNSWSISDISIRRPVFTVMVMLSLIVLGIIGFFRLGVDLFPDVSFPVVSITTPYPGAGPEEIEQLVTRPVEDAVSSMNGLNEVRSYSREGASVVIVMFKLGTDSKQASLDVRDRVSAAHRGMPLEVHDSEFLRFDLSAAPVMMLVLGADADPIEVRRVADKVVRPILEQADGVAAVNIRGGGVREIQVELRAADLAHYGISVAQVSQALSMENLNVPTGRLTDSRSESVVRLQGQFTELDQIRNLVVGQAGGSPVRIRDLGEVKDSEAERRTLVRVNGKEAVSMEIVKQSGANTIAVADGVEAAIVEARTQLDKGWKLEVIADSSEFIRENTWDVEVSIVVGGLAAIAIIFFFMLDWRSTFISALALPASVITTFFGLWLVGFTINMMTLMGLSLAIGFLIDDAIVVRENIYRHIEAGEDPVTAASKGTKEIALAVIATTSCILAVFIPVGFAGGIIGQFFREFALTIAIAVTVSLFVAFTLDPMLSARLVKPRGAHGDEHKGVFGLIRRFLDGIDAGYRSVLVFALRHRIGTIFAVGVVFVGSLGSVWLMGSEFFPEGDRGNFAVAVTMPPGTSLARTESAVKELEGILRADPDVRLVYSTIGTNEARKASMRVKLNDKTERARSMPQVQEELRKKFARVPNVKASMIQVGLVEGDSDIRQMPVSIQVTGPEFAGLERLAAEVEEITAATPGITDLETSWAPGMPEVRVNLDREASSQLGVNAAYVGMAIRSAMVGDTPTRFHDGEDDWDVRVRLQASDRQDLHQIEALPLTTMAGPVSLRQVASLEDATGPATIERLNRQRLITISGNTVGRSVGEVIGDVTEKVEKLEKAQGYSVNMSGQAKDMQDTANAFLISLLLAVVFTYIVLASQFESFVHPITIMASLPLAVIGALLGLFLTGNLLGMSAFIGIILLMGLVTKNAILLVDYANQLRDEKGLDKVSALLEAGPRRLRPILMTSAAMVLGMLPTALSQGAGSEFRSPMSISVIGGVLTSTVLTLVVVPILYTWFDTFTARAMRERRQKREAARLSLEEARQAGK